jgi:hypothetical protein
MGLALYVSDGFKSCDTQRIGMIRRGRENEGNGFYGGRNKP